MSTAARQRIQLVTGDITKLSVAAIVTAANEALVGGHGVDGAVHRAAGPGLFAECRDIGYCPEGEARITKGHLLPAKYIIHTVGPVWEDGRHGEERLLRSCYTNSLQLAEAHGISTIAFPCIATGAHEYPAEEACRVAVAAVANWLESHELPNEVVFCCYEESDATLYRERLSEIGVAI
ncbi:MAG: O-acetyl-ADP-ribose deacetylase [Planctomycetia bacterium]|nr:O-acetyl-ADP-ribose deacetylase [Planctomycetia bacterium]